MPPNDKLERMMNLAAALLSSERPLSAAEIARRVSGYPDDKVAFRRSFQRDKSDLSELGVPVRMEDIPGTYPVEIGYRIDPADYELPDPGLAADELAALHLALQAVRLGDGDDSVDGTEALWKLGGVVEGPEDDLRAPTVASLTGDPSLVPLFTAVLERRAATFSYASGGTPQDRTVDPWRLDNQRGRWYLTGLDHMRGEERNFRLDRIVGEVRLGDAEAFTRPTVAVGGGVGHPWLYGDGEPVMAQLLVDASHAEFARGQLGDDVTVTEHENGSITFDVAVTSWPAFRGFVLSFLDHAELIGPPDLRADLVDWVRAGIQAP